MSDFAAVIWCGRLACWRLLIKPSTQGKIPKPSAKSVRSGGRGGMERKKKKKVHEAVVCVAAVLFTDCNYRYRSMVDNDDDG
jgi:hypothetical protein